MNNSVIILGGNGRLGSSLIDYLKLTTEHKIISVDKVLTGDNNADISLHYDIDDKDLVKDLLNESGEKNLIINAAGIQHSFFTKKINLLNYESPVEFLKNLNYAKINFFFIQISSLSATNGENIIPIAGVGEPINYYGKTKVKFEKFLAKYLTAKNYFILRPGAFYGENYKNTNFDKFISLLRNGIFIFPRKKYLRSYTNIKTVFSSIEIIKNKYFNQKEINCNISNIVDINPISSIDLFYEFKLKYKHKKPPIFLPEYFFQTVAKLSFMLEKKLGIHINLLTLIGEQGFHFYGDIDEFFKIENLNHYETKF